MALYQGCILLLQDGVGVIGHGLSTHVVEGLDKGVPVGGGLVADDIVGVELSHHVLGGVPIDGQVAGDGEVVSRVMYSLTMSRDSWATSE